MIVKPNLGQSSPCIENVVFLAFQVEGLKGVYLCNKFEADLGVMSQRTYITFNKGGNWRLLDTPDEVRHQCPDPQVTVISYVFKSLYDKKMKKGFQIYYKFLIIDDGKVS